MYRYACVFVQFGGVGWEDAVLHKSYRYFQSTAGFFTPKPFKLSFGWGNGGVLREQRRQGMVHGKRTLTLAWAGLFPGFLDGTRRAFAARSSSTKSLPNSRFLCPKPFFRVRT